jgi:hypothetical protein
MIETVSRSLRDPAKRRLDCGAAYLVVADRGVSRIYQNFADPLSLNDENTLAVVL